MLKFLVCVESITSPRPQPQADVQVASQLCCEFPPPNSIGKPREFWGPSFWDRHFLFLEGKNTDWDCVASVFRSPWQSSNQNHHLSICSYLFILVKTSVNLRLPIAFPYTNTKNIQYIRIWTYMSCIKVLSHNLILIFPSLLVTCSHPSLW